MDSSPASRNIDSSDKLSGAARLSDSTELADLSAVASAKVEVSPKSSAQSGGGTPDAKRTKSFGQNQSQAFQHLRLDRVSRNFGSAVALSGLDLTIQTGEFIALLGPSGCGKSTALNCIAGLLPLTAGSIWLDEHRIDQLPPERRGFGMVFQNYALFPHLTVRRNVAFGLVMRRLPRKQIRNRVDAALELVQLQGHGEKLPGQLSGGQQQRVAIARAIVIEPPVILMDEPLSNLDAKLRLEMRTEIKRIHRDLQRTTVYVTHDQDEALSLADRIVVMSDGRTLQIGSPEELYSQPANLQVARFMGYRNILELGVERFEQNRVFLSGFGLQLEGLTGEPLTATRAVTAIRPEDIVVGEAEIGPRSIPPRNLIFGHAEMVEYCGRDYLVDVSTSAGVLLHVRTPKRVAPGDAVRLRVPVERVLVFPPE
ncbi:MAG: ABC transporter ATP-binding protein [Verrucomicrobia bacterium]|nr:ABC transporter ATP-binding protein [Verrucomicrobiota bacterium]